jgi:hypothetical protein
VRKLYAKVWATAKPRQGMEMLAARAAG